MYIHLYNTYAVNHEYFVITIFLDLLAYAENICTILMLMQTGSFVQKLFNTKNYCMIYGS